MQAYVHAGSKVGVLIEVDCNTDFVGQERRLRVLCPRGHDADRGRSTVKYVSRKEVPSQSAQTPRRTSSRSSRQPKRARSLGQAETYSFQLTLHSPVLRPEMHNPKLTARPSTVARRAHHNHQQSIIIRRHHLSFRPARARDDVRNRLLATRRRIVNTDGLTGVDRSSMQ